MWSAASRSFHHKFPTRMKCGPQAWAQTNTRSIKLLSSRYFVTETRRVKNTGIHICLLSYIAEGIIYVPHAFVDCQIWMKFIWEHECQWLYDTSRYWSQCICAFCCWTVSWWRAAGGFQRPSDLIHILDGSVTAGSRTLDKLHNTSNLKF